MKLAREKNIDIYGLNYKDQREDAKRWLIQYGGNPYKAIAFDLDGRAGMDWGVYGVPETFLIDKKGMIRHKHVGPIDPGSWARDFVPLIEKLKAE